MEALAIYGGIVGTTQLMVLAGKLTTDINELIRRIRLLPEEFRRHQITLESIQANLLLLKPLLEDLANDSSIPPRFWQELKRNILELDGDVQTVAGNIKLHCIRNDGAWSARQRLKFYFSPRKDIANSMKLLEASETNLGRTEMVIQLNLTYLLYQMAKEPTRIQPLLPVEANLKPTIVDHKSRISIFGTNSSLRRYGFYGWLINESGPLSTASRTEFSLGFCLSLWVVFLSISVELEFMTFPYQSKWTWKPYIRFQNRVAMASPLMQACQEGNVLLVRRVLENRKGSINDRAIHSGKTPLLVAIDSRCFAVIEFLLQGGADPNLADDYQVTPLFAVAGMNPSKYQYYEQLPPTWDRWLDVFRLLLKHGACLYENVRGRHIGSLNIVRSDTPSKTTGFLRLLFDEGFLHIDAIPNLQYGSALQNALQSGQDAVDALKILHTAGVDLSRETDDGRTALHLAAEWCVDSKPLEYLYSIGCRSINKQDRWGWTALHYAVIARNSAVSTDPFSKAVSLFRNGVDVACRGTTNPTNHYCQPDEDFTASQLLDFARPQRYNLYVDILEGLGICVESEAGDVFYDAEERN
ncbi:MAG: hypothetical protein M1814_004653 [Vezdaea aestivalis]|nr:MAG: hypothetical protein M1814_004653 [Vezdaea aestivalis]